MLDLYDEFSVRIQEGLGYFNGKLERNNYMDSFLNDMSRLRYSYTAEQVDFIKNHEKNIPSGTKIKTIHNKHLSGTNINTSKSTGTILGWVVDKYELKPKTLYYAVQYQRHFKNGLIDNIRITVPEDEIIVMKNLK